MNPKKKKTKKSDDVINEEKKFIKALEVYDFSDYVNFVRSPWKNFGFGIIRGAGWGLGTVLGATVLITILSYILNWLYGFPVIGVWIQELGGFLKL